jgi:hypothetical protein
MAFFLEAASSHTSGRLSKDVEAHTTPPFTSRNCYVMIRYYPLTLHANDMFFIDHNRVIMYALAIERSVHDVNLGRSQLFRAEVNICPPCHSPVPFSANT